MESVVTIILPRLLNGQKSKSSNIAGFRTEGPPRLLALV